MLEKTMKQVITKKVKEWVSTITDESVVDAINKDLIITGGCFTSMIQNEVPKDFDCYFRTKDTVLKVANYYVGLWNETHKNQKNKLGHSTEVFVLDGANPSEEICRYFHTTPELIHEHQAVLVRNCPPERVKLVFPSDGVVGDPEEANGSEELGVDNVNNMIDVDMIDFVTELDETGADEIIEKEKQSYFPVFISSNAITLSNGIQIVVRFYGEPNEIHDTYDFVHTKAYYDNGDKQVVIPKEVYEAVVNKTLIYTGSKYPVCSVFRLRKFIERGWHINAGQMLKMCLQISELDLKDIDVLEDQLVGVDSLYFMNLINQFRLMKEKNKDFDISTQYIVSIIDKIF